MKKLLILHPFLFAAYPVLFLLSSNIDQIEPGQAIRPLVVLLLLAAALWLAFGGLTRNWHQAGLTSSLILLLLLSYGHVYRVLGGAETIFGDHLILGTIWLTLLTLGVFLKWKLPDVGAATRFLNTVAAVILVLPIFNITVFLIQSGGDVVVEREQPLAAPGRGPTGTNSKALPDIYYIIVDGYGRSDVLQELYQHDDGEFIDFLKSRGFFVAENGRSNYVQTSLALASSMNLEYVNYLTESVGENSRSRSALATMIQDSQIRKFLRAFEYQMITFATGYGPTEISDADIYFAYHPELINDLEAMLLAGSAAVALGDRMDSLFSPFICEVQRGGILNIFDHLAQVPALEGPNFVFAHIMSPHPPFVFGPNGEAVKYGECNGLDGSSFEGNSEEYASGYRSQVAHIGHLLAETIDQILADSESPPIIIIQGDHGPGMFLDWDSAENSCLRERISILNAYYLPDGDKGQLYDSITPVNSFRVVLNSTFGMELPLLADAYYFSTWQHPYRFADIGDQIEESCD